MRSAQAAKETSQLIEENARQAKMGMEVTREAGQSIDEMIEETRRVAEILGQIESSSHDQSEGIQEITSTVAQMQTVTQNNNDNAKETALASEDMALHAATLRTVVKQLISIVEGVKGKEKAQDRTLVKRLFARVAPKAKGAQTKPVPASAVSAGPPSATGEVLSAEKVSAN